MKICLCFFVYVNAANRHKINIAPYEENVYYLTYQDKI